MVNCVALCYTDRVLVRIRT